MKAELLLKFAFEASHSLGGYETPHPHLWRLEITVGGDPIEGRIIDIVQLRTGIQREINALEKTFLNDHPKVSPEVRQFPTCETLSHFFATTLEGILQREFLPSNPTAHLISVLVAICDLDGTEAGAVRLSCLSSRSENQNSIFSFPPELPQVAQSRH